MPKQNEKGEFYLSGAIVEAYRARNDLSTLYHVVIPTRHAIRDSIWRVGEPL
jgi:hypothetical protein